MRAIAWLALGLAWFAVGIGAEWYEIGAAAEVHDGRTGQ